MTLARLRLARTEGVGPINYRRLLSRFGSAEAALDALPSLARHAGRQRGSGVPSQSAVQREWDAVTRLGGQMLFLGDPLYPPLLAMIETAPAVISVLGDPALFRRQAVAIVGARNASANGQRMAELLASDLCIQSVVVISGLARGIDTAAHRGAMRTGQTIAAIAGGLDMPYPPENTELQAEIAESGCVVAEAPLGTAPQARHFPRRNRIIAGLSLGVVVIEAAPRSGSLITARMADEASRALFAVPGSPLDPRCHGSNDLIRSEGAHLTESAADVMANLPGPLWQEALDGQKAVPAGFSEPPAPFEDLEVVRLKLTQLLSPTPVPVDDLVRRCQFSAAAVQGVLQEMEWEGLIQVLGHRVCQVQ